MAILEGKKVIIIGDRDVFQDQLLQNVQRQLAQKLFFLQQNVSSELAQAQWILKIRKG